MPPTVSGVCFSCTCCRARTSNGAGRSDAVFQTLAAGDGSRRCRRQLAAVSGERRQVCCNPLLPRPQTGSVSEADYEALVLKLHEIQVSSKAGVT